MSDREKILKVPTEGGEEHVFLEELLSNLWPG